MGLSGCLRRPAAVSVRGICDHGRALARKRIAVAWRQGAWLFDVTARLSIGGAVCGQRGAAEFLEPVG